MSAIPGFRKRSDRPELMDDLALPGPLLRKALADIRLVNKLLGGNSISLLGLKPFLHEERTGPLCVVDVGCGNGEFLRHLAGFCRKKGIEVSLFGWDRNRQSLEQGRKLSAGFDEIRFEQRDILEDPPLPEGNPVVICNLFLHHFSDTQIQNMLSSWLLGGCRAIVVNDLHRNPVAYYLFCLFGAIFMKSRIARQDGLVSIRRGFSRQELEGFSRQLGSVDAQIRWRWAFRYLWVLQTNEKE